MREILVLVSLRMIWKTQKGGHEKTTTSDNRMTLAVAVSSGVLTTKAFGGSKTPKDRKARYNLLRSTEYCFTILLEREMLK